VVDDLDCLCWKAGGDDVGMQSLDGCRPCVVGFLIGEDEERQLGGD
jgi:hypothetical protein